MKNIIALLLLGQLSVYYIAAQGCLPNGIIFETQKAIDSFPTYYPGCHSIEGSLIIDGTDILHLDSLAVLTSVKGDLSIQKTSQLISLRGLDNLDSLGGSLNIQENQILTDLSAFSSIKTIIGDLHISLNNQLTELTGLDSVKQIKGGLIIASNPELLSLDKLQDLQSVVDQIDILSNRRLKHLYGLEGITFHLGTIKISNNDSLLDYHGFDNLRIQRSYMFIESNPMAVDFTGFGALQETYGLEIYKSPASNLAGFNQLALIGSGGLEIGKNQQLESLEGMPLLRQIGSYLYFYHNNQLDSLKGLEQLEEIFGLILDGNDSLVSLEGLNGLKTIEQEIRILNNPMLQDLSALNDTYGLGSRLWISGNNRLQNLHGLDHLCETALYELIIEDNPNLSVCNTECICADLEQGGMSTIDGNSPGCNTSDEIIASCMVAADDPESTATIHVSPNPTAQWIEISGMPLSPFQYLLYDDIGRLFLRGVANEPRIDLKNLSGGIYLLIIKTGEKMTCHRIVKI